MSKKAPPSVPVVKSTTEPPKIKPISKVGNKKGEVVTMNALAHLMGVTPRTIKNWTMDGMPCEEQTHGKSWLFDSAACFKWRIEKETKDVQSLYDNLFNKEHITKEHAERRSAVAKMHMDELKLQKELGQVAVIDDLIVNFAAVLGRVKGKLVGMTSRLSGQLSHQDQEGVEEILDIEVKEILGELTEYEHTFIDSE